ncbi:sulfite exporter TauE/SafE family protein [Stappia sp. ES.058]|uniref:sulfite exporter TauE/SafE family protein n=1 Tax=Stappia sp. ES.058 TaxID=1881061 RepID=UPI00087D4E2C|nr:sulfite exporter TauE/SafE family protein [Stappia sp. ES.058]SDU41347.1 Sulfite exporter TauE/SafE [Stappia sp. ES.058]
MTPDALLDLLLPADLSGLTAALLIAASFATSAVSAAFGLGGGIMLIAVMAQVLPAAAIVPVHGAVQTGSNAGRALVLLRHVDWPVALWFLAGALVGAFAGGALAIRLPAELLRIGIGLFVLWFIWGPTPRFQHMRKRAMTAAGLIATFLSMIFGAGGPIGGAVLSTLGLARQPFVATQATTALMSHVLKLVVFGLLGFAFAPWLGLIALMIASGFLGTLAGANLLGRMPENIFRTGFRIVMTGLAFSLILRGTASLLAF